MMAAVGVLILGCGKEQYAKIQKITEVSQTIGGPSAVGWIGDYLLENDQIRAIIHARPTHTGDTNVFGGTIVDLDLQRPEEMYSNGRGLDQFQEFGPMLNLKVPDPEKFEVLGPAAYQGPGAVLRVKSNGGDLIPALGLLSTLLSRGFTPDGMKMYIDYEIRPGESHVHMTTTIYQQGNINDPVTDLAAFTTSRALVEMVAGDISGGTCKSDSDCKAGEVCDTVIGLVSFKVCRTQSSNMPGAYAGALLLFGGKVKIFVPGMGFEPWLNMFGAVDQGKDPMAHPSPYNFLAAVGDKVSYAVFSDKGAMLIPLASESFTVGLSHGANCTLGDLNCLKGKALRFKSYISVGKGDVGSALKSFYQVRNIPTGTLRGTIVDQQSGKPVPHADIFVIHDPWPNDSDEVVSKRTYREAISRNRLNTRSDVYPTGSAGLVSHFKSDVGTDPQLDGDFGGELPVGLGGAPKSYLLVARTKHRPFSNLVRVRIEQGKTTHVAVQFPIPGTLEFEVRDLNGKGLPAKVTLGQCFQECSPEGSFDECEARGKKCDAETRRCMPKNGCASDSDCDADEWCDVPSRRCLCNHVTPLPRELGGKWLGDNTKLVVHTPDGKGRMEMPPGVYEAIFSRGFEYAIDRQMVELKPGLSTLVQARLDRVVDTHGWISADFHVHGQNSSDSGALFLPRVISYAAEGVEFLSSSDHDVLTNYLPIIYGLGLEPWLNTQVGIEVSPLMLTHVLGFPMAMDETQSQNMPSDKAFDWYNKPAGELFDLIRKGGTLNGGGDAVVVVPHIYDYFNYYDMDSWTLTMEAGVMSMADPLLFPSQFSGNFDGLEIANGKSMDYIRRPTASEVKDFHDKIIPIRQAFSRGDFDYDEFSRRSWNLGREIMGRMLTRTAEEQDAFMDFNNPAGECECMNNDMCGEGKTCDPSIMTCVTVCTKNADCDDGANEVCVPAQSRCRTPCTSNADCAGAKYKSCDTGTGYCKADAMSGNDPCRPLRGVVDDWFMLLNRGVNKTALANSDSHDTYHIEAGMPRNYVASMEDLPAYLDNQKISRAVRDKRVVSTYGPFVRFTINGQEIGSTVKTAAAGESVNLHVTVQSPLWFDVHRLELYANGRLVEAIDGCDLNPGQEGVTCFALPNTQVVNLNRTFKLKPQVDTWYAVVALGVRGKTMGPVYSSLVSTRFGMVEVTGSLFEAIPITGGGATPRSTTIHPIFPYALTNPIWVDVGGDGFSPIGGAPPSWANR